MVDLKAKDLMEKPNLISPKESIEEVKKRLIGSEDILIVVDKKGKFLGEIHERNLLKLIVPENRLDEEDVTGIIGTCYDDDFVADNAEKIMTPHKFSVRSNTNAEDISIILYKEDIVSVPVIEKGKIIGVIHQNKFIREMLK